MSEPGSANAACPFCSPFADRLFYQSDLVLGLWDGFPVSPGHALLVPRRHVATWFEASAVEKAALTAAIDAAKLEIEKRHRPDGYNIGINCGTAAGQTVFHLHVHVIPRYVGDMSDPRGGVRHVIPHKGNYLAGVQDAGERREVEKPLLVAGGDTDPLLPHLKIQLARASAVDIAVAFTLRSGVEALNSHLQELLERGGRLRFLTGDYLDSTDPDALLAMLDLESVSPGALQRRVYQTRLRSTAAGDQVQSFHPKAYVFTYPDGAGSAFVGSSNLSLPALATGVEWNYRVVSSREAGGFAEIRRAFERLFAHPATTDLSPEWIEAYRVRRQATLQISIPDPRREEVVEPPPSIPEPHGVQREALEALRRARNAGAKAGLVVLATGLGKTWLSAFDSVDFRRVLFVAHREEILTQAMQTYRRIRPSDYLGHFTGTDKHPRAAAVFASVQTLSRWANLESFAPDRFDYIVVDEFHHASAATYRRLIEYFEPHFLLGLTATPERSDGADLLELCGGNLIYRCDLAEGIRRDLLCPFRYFGVPDEVDYCNIPWRSTRFDEEQLTAAVAVESRARNALEQLERRGGKKVIAFCVSQRHADFVADFFERSGKRAVAVHSGLNSAPRVESLERLARGELDIVCAVDMFNEGVDLPELDTVLMLRPTESRILWLQQFGRGLRKGHPEKRLAVIDYIGNHRTFLLKPRTLFDLPAGDAAIQNLLDQLAAGTAELPPGCEVTYDLEAVNILRGLLRAGPNAAEALRSYVTDFTELHGIRPTALEAFRDGYNPRSVLASFGSWFGFLEHCEVLSESEDRAWKAAADFLKSLEITPMSKSFKMLVLLGMINAGRFPGSIPVQELAREVRRLLERHPMLREEFGASLETDDGLVANLERNPIEAWTGGAGTGGQRYFEYRDEVFSSRVEVQSEDRTTLQQRVRELAEWRLAEYMERVIAEPGSYVLRVSHANGRPLIFLPDRVTHPDLPTGWSRVMADGTAYEANFVKVAINVLRRPGSEENALSSVMRAWFGPDAGLPGTRHQVRLFQEGSDWRLEAVGRLANGLTLWREYSREQIPPLFGLQFSQAVWNKGFVRVGKHAVLLVTLDKSGKAQQHKYVDRFASAELFDWQTQNKTRRDTETGRSISQPEERGVNFHLFVRERSKRPDGRSSPFVYCGDLDFDSWKGDAPISVRWRLRAALPEVLQSRFLETALPDAT